MRQNFTYEVVFSVLKEMAELFEDSYFHLGYELVNIVHSLFYRGDEVTSACLDEDPTVKIWMQQHGMNTSSYDDLVNYYEQKVIEFISPYKTPVFWQEVFEESQADPNVRLGNGTIIGNESINFSFDKLF